MKLIRVLDGIYRNEKGNVAVVRTMTRVKYESDRPWTVTYRDCLGGKVVKRYRTLADARASLKQS